MSDVLNDPIQIDNPKPELDVVRISVLVDESGSMVGCADDTIKNLNGYIDEQSGKEKTILISLYTFNSDTGVRVRFSGIDAKDAPRMSLANTDSKYVYSPNGGTPLYDAIGRVITLEAADDTPTLVVILTDGEENASQEFRTKTAINELIKAQEEKGWTFVFLMAGLTREESVQYTSSLMGRAYGGATMSYAKGTEDVAFRGLVASSASWEGKARDARLKGKLLDAQAETQNFFDEGVRDIKKD